MVYENATYTVYHHFNNKFSIYKNTEQIASLEELRTHLFAHNWILTLHDPLDYYVTIVLSYALFILSGTQFTIGDGSECPGYTSPRIELKKFDKNWLLNN